MAPAQRPRIPSPRSRATSRGRLGRFVLLLAASVPLAAVPEDAFAQALRLTRPLEVPAPGWVRVPLGPEMLRRTSAGGGFQLFGPEGEELAFRRERARIEPLRRAVGIGAPEASEGGWWIPLEVAPGARLHERLLIETGLETAAPAGTPLAVRVEGSADGESWLPLASGELRSVEGAEGRFAVSYPATDLTRLRLFVPRPGSTAPDVERAAVAEVPPGSSRLSLARPECRVGEPSTEGRRTVCRLPVGGAGHHLRHVCLLVASSEPVGYRLMAAEEGRWEIAAEGVWEAAAEDVPRCIRSRLELARTGRGGGGPAEIEPLRLELHSAGGDGATVREASVELAPEELLFLARRAGLHTLAYGPAVLAGGPGAEPSEAAAAAALRIEAGPAEATEVPIEEASLVPDRRSGGGTAGPWQETWPIVVETPQPGQVYRLALPAEVYGVAREGLPDLRLLRSGSEGRSESGAPVPFVRWRPQAPELVAEYPDQRLRPSGGSRRVSIEPPRPGLPLSALVVTAVPAGGGAPPQPFRRRVRVRYVEPAPPADPETDGEAGDARDADARGSLEAEPAEATRGLGPWVEWRCAPRPPLPCRVTLALDGAPARRVTLEIDDRGETPLSRVHLELWRRRDVLLFAWPPGAPSGAAAGPVLAAGAEGVDALELDDPSSLARLLARPWQEARVAVDGAGVADGGRLGRWAIGIALVAAAVALLVLLDRILAEQVARPAPATGGESPREGRE